MAAEPLDINPVEIIERYLRLLYRPGDVFEVRAPKCPERPGSSYRSTVAGYYTYDAISKAAADIAALDKKGVAPGIYITLNPVDPTLLARAVNQLKPKADSTTAGVNVPRRRRLLIDLDPVRPAGMSSSEAELALAAERAETVKRYLASRGWGEPLESVSGNGHHLLYEIDLPGDDGGLVERVLKSLAARFDDDRVKLDTGVGDAARICKVVGTMARKGDDLRGVPGVEDRPHRRASFVRIPDVMGPVPRDLLEKEAGFAPAASPVSVRPAAAPTNDKKGRKEKFASFPHTPAGVTSYLRDHGIEVAKERRKSGVTVLDLIACPITGVEAESSEISVLVGEDGVIRYRNLHSRGTGLTWLDVREKLEPGYKAFAESAKNRPTRSKPSEETDPELACEDPGDGEAEPDTQRDRIVRLGLDRYRLGRTAADEPFAVPVDGPNIARMFRGGRAALRSELASAYFKEQRKAPSSGSLADALLVLEGIAMQAEPGPVHLRLARHGTDIVLDLGTPSGRAVVIGPEGWQVVEASPVLFKRTALTAALPEPIRGGTLDPLRELINVSETGWPLALGWLVAAFIPDIEHAILLVGGQQDAGKSTTARSIAGLIDPSTAPLRTAPRDVEEWAVAAVGSWVVPIDNISTIPDWMSDAYCRAVTGDGMVRRALYTDGDLAVLMFQRCLILTSIDTGALKGDLGRRIVQLELQPLTGHRKKRPPKKLRMRYDAARPAILGALLDLVSKVLTVMPTVHLDEFFALADFEEVLAAVDRVLGTRSLQQYKGQWEKIAADVVDGDPIADAVRVFAVKRCIDGPWIGRASDLLQEITPEGKLPPKWPRSAIGFAGPLRRSIPALKAVGVEVVPPDENDKTRRYTLRLTAQNARPPENGVGGPGKGDFGSGDVPGDVMGEVDGDRPTCHSGGLGPAPSGDRPPNRPVENPRSEAANSDSGRSGDLGDVPPPSSTCRDNDEEDMTWTG